MPRYTSLPRRLVHIIFASFLFGLFITKVFPPSACPAPPPQRTQTHRPVWHARAVDDVVAWHTSRLCRFVHVALSPSCHVDDAAAVAQCNWSISVTSWSRPRPHRLTRRSSSTQPDTRYAHLLTSEQTLLRQLDGCDSTATCNTSVPCAYGIEDPSDAFWLRAYNETSKFVVLLHVGLASLIFFVAAIIADGTIFYPRRMGLALESASALILIALSALLYVLLVPRNLQFALWGRGPWNTIAYIFIILLIAVLLPALAVIWISWVMFMIFVIGFLFEHVIVVALATIHFLAVLVMYQISNTALHVRLVYFPGGRNAHGSEDDLSLTDDSVATANDSPTQDVEYDRQLLAIGSTFVRRVRSNWFVERVPHMIEERAMQTMQAHMPDHIHAQLFQEQVPHIDFDDLDVVDRNGSLSVLPDHPTASHRSQLSQLLGIEEGQVPPPPAAGPSNATEATPLLTS